MPDAQRRELKEKNAVTALTGATISSEAVLRAVAGQAGVVLAHSRANVKRPDTKPESGE